MSRLFNAFFAKAYIYCELSNLRSMKRLVFLALVCFGAAFVNAQTPTPDKLNRKDA